MVSQTEKPEMTTMTVTKTFRDRVADLCAKNQPYEDVLEKAIDLLEKQSQNKIQ
jgi:hypothetical protein